MEENVEIMFPSAGMAEDILAQCIASAAAGLGSTDTSGKAQEGETFYHLVTFTLAGEEYGVEIRNVQEIIRATEITLVPGAPGRVRGVINLRGKIIPVVDLRVSFGLPERAANTEQRIIVVELGAKRLGMLVDSVSHVIKLSSEIVEDIPEEATSMNSNYVKWVGKLDDRLIIILDLNRSLTSSDQPCPLNHVQKDAAGDYVP